MVVGPWGRRDYKQHEGVLWGEGTVGVLLGWVGGWFTQICTCVRTHQTGHHGKLIKKGGDGGVKLLKAPQVVSGQAGT